MIKKKRDKGDNELQRDYDNNLKLTNFLVMDFAFTGSMKKKTGPTKKWTSKQIKEEMAKYDAKI